MKFHENPSSDLIKNVPVLWCPCARQLSLDVCLDAGVLCGKPAALADAIK